MDRLTNGCPCLWVVCVQLSDENTDFPVVHPGKACYSTKYTWCALFTYKPQTADAIGIGKVSRCISLVNNTWPC